MPITFLHAEDAKGDHELSLEVSVQKMTVKVNAGSFKLGGKSYFLAEDVFTVDVPKTDTVLNAYLAIHKKTNDVVLLLDEVAAGEEAFGGEVELPYHILHALIRCPMPAGTTDLETLPMDVYKISKKKVS